MNLPKKIGIIDSTKSIDSMLRFDDWEGYDPKKQMIYMAFKINELLDYLRAAPEIANEIPVLLKKEGDVVVHDHRWQVLTKIGGRVVSKCTDCGTVEERLTVNGQ